MLDFITAPLIVGICVLGIYKLFELYARRRERLALIEKLGTCTTDEKIILPEYSNLPFSYGALKVGCLLIGLGIGLLIGYLICAATIQDYVQNLRTWEYKQLSSTIYGACVLLFGGIGLLIAFVTEIKLEKKKKES